MNLYNPNEVNDVEGSMTTTAYLSIHWFDSELTWTPATYGGITAMTFLQVRSNLLFNLVFSLKNPLSC